MLSPAVSRQLKQLLAFYERGVFTQQEFGLHLATLVNQENALEVLDALPAAVVPCLKDAVVAAAQDTADAEFLAPEGSVFQEGAVSATYHLRVAEVLLERSAARSPPDLTVVCLPSFEVEWALCVRGSSRVGFTAVLTEAAEKVWCHPNPLSIQARAKQRALDTGLGEAVLAIWEKALLRTRYPRRRRLGLDGASYHFGYSGGRVGKLAGRTWSPEEGTVPGKLVALSHKLRAYVEADEALVEGARRELDVHIAGLNGLV